MIPIDEINEALDLLSDSQYDSVGQIWQAVSLVLEDYGIIAPDLNDFQEGEELFKLIDDTDCDCCLYLVIDHDDKNPPKYDVYTTIMDREDFQDLEKLKDIMELGLDKAE